MLAVRDDAPGGGGVIMRHAASALLVALALSSCVARPYYGRSVIEDGGELVCGRHGVPVEAHEGFIYNGLITFVDEESLNFASERFPNTLGATFSEEKTADYSIPFTDYTCTECKAGDARLDRLPMWYKRLAGWPAKVRRNFQLERAAARAQRTGNPEDARVPDGDGFRSRIR